MKLNFQVRISHTHAELFRNIAERRGTSHTALLESMIDREVMFEIQKQAMRGERTMIKFHADKAELTAAVEQELYNKETGFTTYIEVVPGGTDNGLDYGPLTIDIVYLAGQQVVYRHGSDDYDSDWDLGYIEDAVEAALGDYEQAQAEQDEFVNHRERWELYDRSGQLVKEVELAGWDKDREVGITNADVADGLYSSDSSGEMEFSPAESAVLSAEIYRETTDITIDGELAGRLVYERLCDWTGRDA